eukprot:s5779_g1.t1
MKFDAQGVHQWTRQRGSERYDGARALQVDAVGNAWVAGVTHSSLDGNTNAGGADVFLMKFDAQGVHQWTRQRGGGDSDYARALQVDGVGNAWLAGYTYSSLDGNTNAGFNDIFLMRFDAQGVHQWTRQRGGEGADYARAFQADWGDVLRVRIFSMEESLVHVLSQVGPIGNAWVAGSTESSLDGHSNAGKEDIFLMKFQAECSQVTCPAGYMPSPSQSNSTCCVRASSEETLPALPALPGSQLEVEQKTSTTTASVNVEIWKKPGTSNDQSIDLGTNTASTSSKNDSTGLSSEDDSNGLLVAAVVAAVVLPVLTACLCAALGICCYRAKLRQLREAEPQVPNPLAMLPPLARSVKPLVFSWNSRMTAEWPRGKVQKLSVSETAFELSGRQFPFRPGQPRHFAWEDGTVQTECRVVEHGASPSCLATLQVGLHSKMPRKVTHFVSWCWAYSLNNVVSAIERWVQKSNEDARNVFLWMCFFCNNQYRIKEEATQTGSDDLKEIFESHLVEAGHMLVLLDTIVQPTYVSRAWCIFESYVCITQDIPMNIILPGAAETFFRETMSMGRINVLTGAVDALNVRHARAGSEKDEDLIKRIILTTTGFDAVNHAVRSRLIDQLTVLFRELFTPQPTGCDLGFDFEGDAFAIAVIAS